MFEILEFFKHFFEYGDNPNKKHWVKVFNDMAVHTRKKRPDELLLKRRPNEEKEVYEYRLANYEPITYGSMNKALDDLYRIVNAVSYTINAPDDFKKYLLELRFNGYANDTQNEELNFDLFLQKIVLKRMIEDPNGFLVWVPTGEGVTDSSKKIDPFPKLIYSCEHHYSDKDVFAYHSEEKTPLSDGKKISMTGEVYYVVTKTQYWKMYQTGTVARPKWTQEMIYKHGLGVLPVITLGGDMNSDGFYESFFCPYLAFGNEAIRQFSDWQAVMTTSSFPYIEEFANECTFKVVRKNSENIPDSEENFTLDKETKLVPLSKSPYNVTLRKIPSNNLNEDTLPVEVPSRRFISPDINVAKYSGESWEKLIEKAEQALNIDMNVGVNQSGVAKQIDKEAQYSMITKIGNNFFDNIMLNSLRIIFAYRAAQAFSMEVNILKPATFWIKNEDDLVAEISTLKEKNVPDFFLAEASLDLAKKRFSGNPVSQKIFSVMSLYDPLFIKSTEEKNSMVSQGVITKEDYTKSVYCFGILNRIAREKSGQEFVKMPDDKVWEEFEKLVEQYLPEEPEPIVIGMNPLKPGEPGYDPKADPNSPEYDPTYDPNA